MPNATDRLAEDLIHSQVTTLRAAEGVSQQLIDELEKAKREIERILLSTDLTRYTRARTQALLTNILKVLNAFAKTGYAITENDIPAIAAEVVKRAARDINEFLGLNVVKPILDARKLRVSLDERSALGGATMQQFWDRQPEEIQQRYAAVIRLGVSTGRSSAEILTDLRADPAFDAIDSRLRSLVRTSTMALANDARMSMYQENGDLIKGFQWLSTLDARTSSICRGLDGLAWNLDYEPIGHSIKYPGPVAHPNCRSTQVPLLRSLSDLATKNRGLAEKLDRRMSDSTRASMDGQVGQDLTYSDWLKKKGDPYAKEVLGEDRFKMWKEDKLDLRDMLDQRGRPLSVEQLKKKLS